MSPKNAVGSWIRSRRAKAGFSSAMSLAKRAGLSPSYVGLVERGRRSVGWSSALKIADALSLSDAERDEFFGLVDAATKPGAVRASTENLAVSGLAMWRHLPAAIFNVPHGRSEFYLLDRDSVVSDAVPAIGALLNWIARTSEPLSAKHREELRTLTYKVYRDYAEFVTSLPSDSRVGFEPAPHKAASTLPGLHRAVAFASSKSTRRLASLIREWEVNGDELTVQFRDDAMNLRLGVELRNARLVASVHESLVACSLWRDLSLASDFGDYPGDRYADAVALRETVQELLGTAREELDSVLAAEWSGDTEFLLQAEADLSVAVRLYEFPSHAATVLGADQPTFCAKLAELTAAIAAWRGH